MKLSGWIFMAAAWTMIFFLILFSYSHILRKEEKKGSHHKSA